MMSRYCYNIIAECRGAVFSDVTRIEFQDAANALEIDAWSIIEGADDMSETDRAAFRKRVDDIQRDVCNGEIAAGEYREAVLGPNHTRLKNGEAHRARIFITREKTA